MTESTNNDQQTNQANPVIPTVSELPSYNDLGTRTQFESLVNLNSPPPQHQQPLFNQSVPVYGSPYGNPYGHLGYPGRPVYYKPATNQPVTFQYQPQPQQYQPQPPQYGAVVQNYSFPQNAARDIFFKNAFPTGYVVFHNVFAILLSLALVTLQVLLLTNSANGSYVGGGFWSGAWMIFTAIFSLSTLGCKNGCTIVSSVVFQLLGVFFTFGGSVVMSLVAASENMPCWSYYDYCDKVVVWQLLYTQAAVGACLMLLSLIFSIFVLVRFARARRQLNEFYNSQYSHMYHQQTLATTNPNYHQNWNNSRAPRLV